MHVIKDIQNPKILHKNRLSSRSTILPVGKIMSLNGEYDFCYDGGEWEKLKVPSMWQYHGYGKARYTNVLYPFPFNPPYTGNYNPVGEYKKKFIIEKLPSKTILHFDGVDGAFYVYINGKEIGFSKGSRLPHEFDVSDYIVEGENELYVKVYTYSDASYLEAQDMILASGIFRSVYLIFSDAVSVWDYTIKTTMNEIEVSVKADLKEDWYIKISVDGQETNEKSHTFKIKNPRLWNAEEPNLYDVEIFLYYKDELKERHIKKVGLREIEIIDGVLCLNKTPIKLKGVNRHEYTCDNGRVIDYETTKKELLLLKENNVNAIRCSHYPNNPFFYTLCNELGFYVMDECDLETHGCGATGDQGFLSKNHDWESAYLDRIERMYERDKNETCIIIWSVGNECGNGENLVKCAEYLRNCEIKKPILYPQDNASDPQFTDFRQCGYCPVWVLEQKEYETTRWCNKPVIMTEYAHAMGNSPGALYEYWEKIYKYKTFAGGFIWEFKNHGVLADDTILYGGDFDDYNNAYNFNLDGFLFSDGTPKPALKELAWVMSSIWVSYDDGVVIKNTNDFTEISGLKWELMENYTVIKSGKLKDVILPQKSIKFSVLPDEYKKGAIYRINIIYKNDIKQVEIPYKLPKEEFKKEKFTYECNSDYIKGDNFEIKFENGMIAYYKVENDVLLDKPIKPNFYRKPTDNDGIKGKMERITSVWDKSFLRYFELFCEDEKIEKYDDEVIFIYKGKILPEGAFVGYFAEISYHIYDGGKVLLSLKAEPYGKMPEILPRIGFCFELPKDFDEVKWYGRGEHENYADRKKSSVYGLYEKNVSDMSVHYERPQENGNRCDTYFVNIGKLNVTGSEKFEFSVHDYSFDNLMNANHKGEIEKSDTNYLYVDYKQRGLGSASCGPEPEEEYELKPHSFRFSFMLKKNDGIFENFKFDETTDKLSDSYTYVPIEKIAENFDCR